VTTRDRLVLITIVVLGILGAGWVEGVSPERAKASKIESEVSAARSQLAAAQQQFGEAQGAQTQYTTAYAAIVRLGKAVPASQEVPSLVYELDQASNQKNVEFNSIQASTTGASASSPSASSSAAAASTAAAGFTQMPFTFIFNGSYADLYRLFSQIQSFTLQTSNGAVQVTGRLLTIQSANLELPNSNSSEESTKSGASAAKKKPENAELKGTITATAYVLPASQGLTGGATAAGPVSSSSSAQPASSSSSSSSSSAPAAVLKVTP
jgi:type II secretory pathway pseudopilin PulG